jgi:alkylated DNA repair dioxygenase AlkB
LVQAAVAPTVTRHRLAARANTARLPAPTVSEMMSRQPSTVMEHSLIPGIQYVPHYIDERTQDQLVTVVDQSPWQLSARHRVQVYGYHYNHRQRAAYRIGELPLWSVAIAERLQRDGFVPTTPNQLVANDYDPGVGIFDHVDQAVFGDVVVSVSLGSTCVMRFTQAEPEASRELLLEPGSVLVLSGEARWDWKHGIPDRLSDRWHDREYVRSRRVSLTFRAVPG